jgi:hypothetical protein
VQPLSILQVLYECCAFDTFFHFDYFIDDVGRALIQDNMVLSHQTCQKFVPIVNQYLNFRILCDALVSKTVLYESYAMVEATHFPYDLIIGLDHKQYDLLGS